MSLLLFTIIKLVAYFITFGVLYFLVLLLWNSVIYNYNKGYYNKYIKKLRVFKDKLLNITFINKLVIKYNRFYLKHFFIKREKYILMFNRIRPINRKDLSRFIKLYLMKFYNNLNHLDVQFDRDIFVRPFTNGKYEHFCVLNIYGLKNKDLFLVTYYYLMSDPNIFCDSEKYSVYFILTSFRDIETNYAGVIEINPYITIDRYTTFRELYLSIVTYYLEIGPVHYLDNTYKLEIRVMRF